MKKRILAAVLTLLCLMISGCSPLIMQIDLNKAVVKEIDFEKVYDISNKVSSYGKEKYNIGGTDAFYILPNGLPEPVSLVDFQVIDLLDGTTTVYAYQALYALEDSTGRGGKPKIGKRQELTIEEETKSKESAEEDSASDKETEKNSGAEFDPGGTEKEKLKKKLQEEEEESKKQEEKEARVWADEDTAAQDSFEPSEVTKMVTVMMAYNTSTGVYNVFFSSVDGVEVKSRGSGGGTSVEVYMLPKEGGIFSMGKSGLTAKEINPIFTQKVNEDFFLYYGGETYLFDRSGRTVYYNDLSKVSVLDSSSWYGSQAREGDPLPSNAMIDHVFMDTRYHIYVQYSYPRVTGGSSAGKASISKDTDAREEQSMDDIEDVSVTTGGQSLSGTTSCLCVINRVDLGNEGGQNSRFFYSDNLNLERQKNVLNQFFEEYTFQTDPEMTDEETSAYLDERINELLVDLHKKEPVEYGTYTFGSSLFPFQLLYFGRWSSLDEETGSIVYHGYYGEGIMKGSEQGAVFQGFRGLLEKTGYSRSSNNITEESAYQRMVDNEYITPVTAVNHDDIMDYTKDHALNTQIFLAYMPAVRDSDSAQLISFYSDVNAMDWLLSKRKKDAFQMSEQTLEYETIEVSARTQDKIYQKKIQLPKRYRMYISGMTVSSKAQVFYLSGGKAYPSQNEGYILSSTADWKESEGVLNIAKRYNLLPDAFIELLRKGTTAAVTKWEVDDTYIHSKRDYAAIINEIPRDVHILSALKSGGTEEKELAVQSDKSIMIFTGDNKTFLVNCSMLLFDTYGDVMNVDFGQPEMGDDETTNSYLNHGLKLYQDEKGTWWLFAASTDRGLLKINLDKCAEFQAETPTKRRPGWSWIIGQDTLKIREGMSYDGSGQISAYPYYCVWLGEGAQSGYAIGFQSTNYSYDIKDLFGAKLYQISFTDETATLNLAYSSIRKNPEFQKAYKEKDMKSCYRSWASNLEILNLMKDEDAQKELANYYSFLESAAVGKDKAYREFTSILTKKRGSEEIVFNEETLKQKLSVCKSRQDLESILTEMRRDLLEEEKTAVKETGASYSSNPLDQIAEAQKQAMEELEKKIQEGYFNTESSTEETKKKESSDNEMKNAEYDESEVRNVEMGIQFFDDRSKIVAELRELCGYTGDQWNEKLDEIAENLHPATTYSEYKLVRRQKEQELAAKTKAEQELAAQLEKKKAEELKLQTELENALREMQERNKAESQQAGIEEYLEAKEAEIREKEAAESKAAAESEAESRALEESRAREAAESLAAEAERKAAEESLASEESSAQQEGEENEEKD